VSDDGAGINTGKVKESAIKHGHLSTETARQMDEASARRLIFQAEVSTSPLITRLSGRGLGLAIVRERAEKLGGSVSVESKPGHGTQFHILVPSMLATFRGVLIETAGRRFVVPTFHVERVARVKTGEVQTVEGRETIALGGRATALVRLAEVLELSPVDLVSDSPTLPVVVLGLGDQRIAFAVDAVLDEQEVLVKPLRKPLLRVRNIAGATVLASGQVAPVLNVADLLKSARKAGGTTPRIVAPPPRAQSRSILVAEDSITSRMMLKGILESAGYRVKTAVDGLEAFTLLRSEKFDLLVSDVEMPRLGGLDLTARIRADKKLAELPVVLVTTLETREDRERGVEVGASAYLIKSRFDQSDLLDAIRRLV
jgi:two-component system chemotaxis sensor kinase CheA